jgi:hypothetical protein
VDEFEVFDAESNSTALILAVPIFVFDIVAVDDTLMDVCATQCISTVLKLLIGKVPM